MQLHEHHARRLEATVLLLEESVARCQRLLREGAGGILRVVQADLEQQKRERLLRLLEAFQQELSQLVQRFELQQRPVGLVQVLNAEFSSMWVMLENCRPKRMKGYGVAFDPEVAAALDRAVDTLLTRIEALRAVVATETDRSVPGEDDD